MNKRTEAIIQQIEDEASTQLMDLSTASSGITSGLSSGSLSLNEAMSGNWRFGYAWGRVAEIYGPEQSGKTTLSLTAIAEAQRKGHLVGFIDLEQALDFGYAEAIGVKTDELLFKQPDYGEQAVSLARAMIRNGVKVVVMDSLAVLTPKAEIEGDIGEARMGQRAKLITQFLNTAIPLVREHDALLILINQVRKKLGISFGNPEYTPGGDATKYLASYRLEIRSPRGGALKEGVDGEKGKQEVGIGSKVTIKKNKVYPPYKIANVIIRYGVGIDKKADLIQYAMKGQSSIEVNGVKYSKKKLYEAIKSKAFRKELYASF